MLKELHMLTEMESKQYKKQVLDWVKDLIALGVSPDTSAIVARDFLVPRWYDPVPEAGKPEENGVVLTNEFERNANAGKVIEVVRHSDECCDPDAPAFYVEEHNTGIVGGFVKNENDE